MESTYCPKCQIDQEDISLSKLTKLVDEVLYLLNREFLPGNFCHLSDGLNMVLKLHLQAAGEGQVGFGFDVNLYLL